MNNRIEGDSENFINELVTNLVTPIISNTHCIVCGKAFQTARKGKLYCSPGSKQFGYNHKAQLNHSLTIQERGISPKPMKFSIEDFTSYDKLKKIKTYRELKMKNAQWELADLELRFRLNSAFPMPNYFIGYLCKYS